MKDETVRKLTEINRYFYDAYGEAFAATRCRIQPGVRRILTDIPREQPQNWLDIGCGSGALAFSWAEEDRSGTYTGMDFSSPLLLRARDAASACTSEKLVVTYQEGDLMNAEWSNSFPQMYFDGVFAFASLHHIPGFSNHKRIFKSVWSLLKGNGRFILSVWQFQNSQKLRDRVQPWSVAGIDDADLDPGDTLLDWRYVLPDSKNENGLRYVHLFSEAELTALAEETGFRVEKTFYSDGAEGNLALYLICRKPEKKDNDFLKSR